MKNPLRILSRLGIAAMWIVLAACQSKPSPSVATQPAPATTPRSAPAPASVEPLPDDSVPEIARREVIRRQERIRQMDEAALRASQAMAEDDLEGAVGGFRRAVDGLP